jgi:hypothetical protein
VVKTKKIKGYCANARKKPGGGEAYIALNIEDNRRRLIYGGKRPCLRCSKEFQSQDLRVNRICPKCNLANANAHTAICLSVLPGRRGGTSRVPVEAQ